MYLANLLLDSEQQIRLVTQESLNVFAPLPKPFAIVRVPCPGFFDHIGGNGQIQHIPFTGNASAVNDVKLHLLKRRGYLVFDYFSRASGCPQYPGLP